MRAIFAKGNRQTIAKLLEVRREAQRAKTNGCSCACRAFS